MVTCWSGLIMIHANAANSTNLKSPPDSETRRRGEEKEVEKWRKKKRTSGPAEPGQAEPQTPLYVGSGCLDLLPSFLVPIAISKLPNGVFWEISRIKSKSTCTCKEELQSRKKNDDHGQFADDRKVVVMAEMTVVLCGCASSSDGGG
ncbi:hypothetical protein BVC80_8977g35 [Macleaya cordata]|uniref:Uncharacterized protein n=1 Tax=Macleaya cordata TaxID=56857 RepID=A0A200PYE3_MACCD|nr:hypothetical protein BVC80_8977g35 [Macleaya cordata]